ncbi:MAG: M20/M25/M40 family metallo-hydrolase [Ginsengibacter sp.]
MKKSFLLIIAILFSVMSFSQQNDSIMVKKIVDEVLINGDAYSNLKKLCKDVGHRLSGSENFLKAVALTSKMLKDAGADTVYLQECKIPHWVRGEKEKGEIIFKNGKTHQFHLTALGNSVGTPSKGITSVKIVEVKNLADIPMMANELKGNIVFLNIPMNPTYINTFRAYGESTGSRTYGPSMAAKYGAIGALVRTLDVNINDVPHTGVTRYNDSFPKIPAVAISTKDAELLSKELKNNQVKSVWFFTGCKILPDAIGYNVVGEIRGSEFPKEIITVGGHLDSWDLAEGANDDGSGVVQSIEVIRSFKSLGIHPKRTIRTVLFADEEISGKGSAAYLSNAITNQEHHIFALESDAGGFSPRGFGFDASNAKMNQILGWKPLFLPYGVYEFYRGGGGSDIGPLKKIGATLAGLMPDSQRYFDIHHATTDVFENVSERELKLGAGVMAALIYLVSEYGI